MIDHPVDSLLPDWAAWVRRENDAGLGYSQVQYSEYIAKATSATGYTGDFDPRILRLDKLIRLQLAYTPRRMLELRYVYGLPDKKAAQLLSLDRPSYNKMLNVIVLPQLRHSWDFSAVATKQTLDRG